MKTTTLLIALSCLLLNGCSTPDGGHTTKDQKRLDDHEIVARQQSTEQRPRRLSEIKGGTIESERETRRALEKAAAEKRRVDYVAAHPELPALFKERIMAGDVVIGMSSKDVIASLGVRWNGNRSVSDYAVDEQWVYVRGAGKIIESTSDDAGSWARSSYSSRLYLYFKDGVLRSWQE